MGGAGAEGQEVDNGEVMAKMSMGRETGQVEGMDEESEQFAVKSAFTVTESVSINVTYTEHQAALRWSSSYKARTSA